MDHESINEDLASATFEELLKIREKIGTKIYRQTVLKSLQKQHRQQQSDDESPVSVDKNLKKRKTLVKNRMKKPSEPIEASSKRLDFSLNQLQLVKNNQNQIKFHDPRFNENIGQFKRDKFELNYHFLNEIRTNELQFLKHKFKKAKNLETREKLQFLIKRLENQLDNDKHVAQQKLLKQKLAKQAQESGQKSSRQSQRPRQQAFQITEFKDSPSNEKTNAKSDPKNRIHHNKSQLKRYELLEKFKQLKQTGKLQKYMERKRKKLMKKDRKYMSN